jgi:cytochrome P450
MTTRIMDPAARVLADPQAYTDEKRLYESLAHLRAHAPVSWVDVGDYRPFWAITKHADIMDIERQNDLFTNYPGRCWRRRGRRRAAAGPGGRHRPADPDPHGRSAPPRRPQDRRRLVPAVRTEEAQGRCDELAKIWVDKMAEKGPSSIS